MKQLQVKHTALFHAYRQIHLQAITYFLLLLDNLQKLQKIFKVMHEELESGKSGISNGFKRSVTTSSFKTI